MTPLRSMGPLAFLIVALLLALATAGSPPARGASNFGDPIVVVYPLSFAGAASGNEAGSDVSIVISQRLAESGGLIVKPPIPGTTRAQYLDAAISQRADYYVTGFLQTIGNDVSMIVQVVSTHSGSVVFSTTTTIRTFADAGLQAEPVRIAILRHAGRGLASLDEPTPNADVSPSSKPTNGPGVNLSRAFRKRRPTTAAPSASPTSDSGYTSVSEIEHSAASPSPAPAGPSPTPPPVATAAPRRAALVTPAPRPSTAAAPVTTFVPVPSFSPSTSPTALSTPSSAVVAASSRRGRNRDASASQSTSVLVVDTGGGEDAALRNLASDSLVTALRGVSVKAARLPISGDEAIKNAPSICGANPGTTRFYVPSLVTGHDDAGAPVARLTVIAVDCTGATLATRTSSGFGNVRSGDGFAVDRAAAKVVPLLAGT